MKPKHTPRPWIVKYDGDGCHCDFGIGVFNTVESDELNDIEELNANCNLMAAAPEMLQALKTLAERFYIEHRTDNERNGEWECGCNQFQDNNECRHIAALKTIAKAEGEKL